MAIVSEKQYNQIALEQRREQLALTRQEKITILSTYLNQTDEVLDAIDRIPDRMYKDTDLLKSELALLDIQIDRFNSEVYPDVIIGMGALAFLGADHTVDPVRVAGSNVIIDELIVDKAIARIEIPFQRDLDYLIKNGIYEARTFSKVNLQAGISLGGENRYNNMLEKISRMQGAEQQKAAQALVNYANASDPVGNTVRNMGRLYGVEPQGDYRLSQAIWGPGKRDFIYSKVINNANSGISPSQTVKELETFLKESGQGGAYYKAERVVDTELNNAYLQGKKEGAEHMKEIGVEVYLTRKTSPVHTVPDACDDLVGTYRPKDLPENPHPLCTCLVGQILSRDFRGKLSK